MAAAGLLGAGAALGVPAGWRSAAARPPAAGHSVSAAAAAQPGAAPGTGRLTSFSVPVARLARNAAPAIAPLHGLLQADIIVVAPSSLPAGATWVWDQPFFLLLNFAVGGNWPGSPNGTTSWPQQMIVDYVRVYTASGASAPPASGG